MRSRPHPHVAVRTALSGLLAVIVLVAMLPAAAGAQDPATDAYAGSAPNIASGTVQTPVQPEAVPEAEAAPAAVSEQEPAPAAAEPAVAARSVPSGSIPFTGLQLALIAAAGIGVLGLGVLLRRSTRSVLSGA